MNGCELYAEQISAYVDGRPTPPTGDGYFYLIRASNPCGVASVGSGRELLQTLDCSVP